MEPHLGRVGLASLERVRQSRHSLRALDRILVDVLRRNRRRKHPQLTIGDVIECRGVDLEVLCEDFFRDVRHPVGHGESRVLAELAVVEDLISTQRGVHREDRCAYKKELAAVGNIVESLKSVRDTRREVPQVSGILVQKH